MKTNEEISDQNSDKVMFAVSNQGMSENEIENANELENLHLFQTMEDAIDYSNKLKNESADTNTPIIFPVFLVSIPKKRFDQQVEIDISDEADVKVFRVCYSVLNPEGILETKSKALEFSGTCHFKYSDNSNDNVQQDAAQPESVSVSNPVEPEQPVAQAEQPVAQAEQPVAQPEQPVAQPEQRGAQPVPVDAQNPIAQPVNVNANQQKRNIAKQWNHFVGAALVIGLAASLHFGGLAFFAAACVLSTALLVTASHKQKATIKKDTHPNNLDYSELIRDLTFELKKQKLLDETICDVINDTKIFINNNDNPGSRAERLEKLSQGLASIHSSGNPQDKNKSTEAYKALVKCKP